MVLEAVSHLHQPYLITYLHPKHLVLTSEDSVTLPQSPQIQKRQCRRQKKLESLKPNYLEPRGKRPDSHVSNSWTRIVGPLYTLWMLHCISKTLWLSKSEAKYTLLKTSKIAIVCSYQIFNYRDSVSWDLLYLYTAILSMCRFTVPHLLWSLTWKKSVLGARNIIIT